MGLDPEARERFLEAQRYYDEKPIKDKAWFCLLTGISPSEYMNMTPKEISIFAEVQQEIVRKQNRK